MIANLAAVRYRNVCADDGGPISVIETGLFNLRGQEVYQANATLRDELAPKRGAQLFSPVDGSGTHRSAAIARHIAVSEAIERWALLTALRDDSGPHYGLSADPTSNGMAAYPGFLARQARRFAWLEAVERYCLFGWWEERLVGQFFETSWAGVSGVEISGPFDRTAVRVVILFTRTANGRYAYGHAAGISSAAAQDRALIELCRHEAALDMWDDKCRGGGGGGTACGSALNRMEQRSLYFSTPEGFAAFWARVEASKSVRGGTSTQPEILFDGEIPGPWRRYAYVWRVVFRPETRRFIEEGKSFFFW